MFKSTLAALVTLLILTTTAFAANHRTSRCDPDKVPGSYVRQINQYYMDQLKLSSDGTAYWYQSTAFDLMLTAGTYIPEIGSWNCLNDGSVLVTTVGTNYDSTGGDIHISQNTRFTQKLTVVNNDTLQPTDRITTDTALSADPLGPGVVQPFPSSCTASANSCDPSSYRRVKPLITDIP